MSNYYGRRRRPQQQAPEPEAPKENLDPLDADAELLKRAKTLQRELTNQMKEIIMLSYFSEGMMSDIIHGMLIALMKVARIMDWDDQHVTTLMMQAFTINAKETLTLETKELAARLIEGRIKTMEKKRGLKIEG